MYNHSTLYSALTRFGEYYPIRLEYKVMGIIEELEQKFKWVQYNPRKNIDRHGLSITSLDGGLTGRPDLDSFFEYYKETGIVLHDNDFTIKTPVYLYFEKWLKPFENELGRTHVIKLNQGGFFPPHRDHKHANIDSFRLFLPLNYNSDSVFFMLDHHKMEFKNGSMYFINTAKMHTLFNTSPTPFYFVVANIRLTEETVETVATHLLG